MKNILLLIFGLLVFFGYSQVNAEEARKTQGRWVVGGGMGLGFNNGFNIQASPEVGYRKNNFEVGLGLGLNYINYDDGFVDYTSTLWSGGPYALFMPVPEFFLRGQYAYYSGSQEYQNAGKESYDESTLWIGGGYQSRIANHVYMRIGIMYNVLYEEGNSIFGTAWVPIIGVSAGL